jgi:hypothetical protein
MPAARKKSMRKVTRRVTATKAKAQTISATTRSRLSKAAKGLERAAAKYAKIASNAGLAAGKAVKKASHSRTAKIMAVAAVAAAGFVLGKKGRRRR